MSPDDMAESNDGRSLCSRLLAPCDGTYSGSIVGGSRCSRRLRTNWLSNDELANTVTRESLDVRRMLGARMSAALSARPGICKLTEVLWCHLGDGHHFGVEEELHKADHEQQDAAVVVG